MSVKYIDETGTIFKSLKSAKTALKNTHLTEVFQTNDDLRKIKMPDMRIAEELTGNWVRI
jgi:hypothetical protein